MSASEKLAALDEAMRIDVPTSRPLFEKARNAEHDVLRALPQIVAVVEVAEKTLPWNQVDANELPLRRALASGKDRP